MNDPIEIPDRITLRWLRSVGEGKTWPNAFELYDWHEEHRVPDSIYVRFLAIENPEGDSVLSSIAEAEGVAGLRPFALEQLTKEMLVKGDNDRVLEAIVAHNDTEAIPWRRYRPNEWLSSLGRLKRLQKEWRITQAGHPEFVKFCRRVEALAEVKRRERIEIDET